MTMSFFRYPGGKSKLRNQIVSRLDTITNGNNIEYREPFFGGGSIGLKVLQDNTLIKKLWINDKDLGISCLWTSLIQCPDLLKKLVKKFKPSIQKFDDFKTKLTASELPEPKTHDEIAEFGFMKLAIHQISYSGLGTMSGGPLGGRKKENVAGRGMTDEVKYPIDCRWSPDYICKKIDQLHAKMLGLSIRNNRCTCLDFADVINDTQNDAVIYLDPPYFVKGNDLYQHGFTEKDHYRLAVALKNTKHQWVLSYDDCPEIRKLYQWAKIEEIDGVNYSITALKDKTTGERLTRNKMELLIIPKNFIIEDIVITKGSFDVQSSEDFRATNCEAAI
jgi:DNA adenine methylase